MPGFLLHVGARAVCPHTMPVPGQVNVASTNIRVLVSGRPVATVTDPATVVGCPFQVPLPAGPKPQPCVRVQWMVPAARVFVMGRPALLQTSTGVCFSVEQIPQGAPSVLATQTRVFAI